jgi:hypothetical protein
MRFANLIALQITPSRGFNIDFGSSVAAVLGAYFLLYTERDLTLLG